jgi:hypothetical protein
MGGQLISLAAGWCSSCFIRNGIQLYANLASKIINSTATNNNYHFTGERTFE